VPDEPANLVNFAITGADYFRDVSLHRQLTVEMDAEIADFTGLITVVPVSSVRSESAIFSSIWREPNHISSVLAALSGSLRDAHHEEAHISNVVGVCSFYLRQLRLIRHSLSDDAAHTLVCALIHSRLASVY